jgi:hypothetical protein
MKLLVSQKNVLAEILEKMRYNISDFNFIENELETAIVLKENSEFMFLFRESIQGAKFCDIYYIPTNKQVCKHIYLSIDSFEEIISCFKEWLDCLSLEIGIEDKWSKK